MPHGAPLRLRVRARDVMVATARPEGLSALNQLPAEVVEIGPPHGAAVEVRLACGSVPLLARITRHSVERLDLKPGRRLWAVIKSVALASEPDDDADPAIRDACPKRQRARGTRPAANRKRTAGDRTWKSRVDAAS